MPVSIGKEKGPARWMADSLQGPPELVRPGADGSLSGRLIRVTAPLFVALAVLVLLLLFTTDTISSLRAAVTGEARYSKSQKAAVLALHRYAHRGEADDLRIFNNKLAINLGLIRTYNALIISPPNWPAAVEGLEASELPPVDVPGMLRLFTYFRFLPEIRNAMQDWGEANGHIMVILDGANRMHTLVKAGERDSPSLEMLLSDIDREDAALQILEDRFSERLGITSRAVDRMHLIGLMLVSLISVLLVMRTWARVLKREDTHREALEKSRSEYAHRSVHDDLTGLLNRRGFSAKLENLLAGDRAVNLERTALFYLDLDQFKVVNDTSGHQAGDAMLRQVVATLTACLRPGACLARLGGDEFGILLHDMESGEAVAEAKKMVAALGNLVFFWENRIYRSGVSIGLVMLGDVAPTLTEVLRAADAACIVAKDNGRGQVHVFHPDDNLVRERRSEMEWVGRIRDALHNNDFRLSIQPIGRILSDRVEVHSAEILIRMRDENNALYLPGVFLPAALRYGMMREIDRWVIRHGLRAVMRMPPPKNGVLLSFGINLSAASITDSTLPGFVAENLRETGLSADRVSFEITETDAVSCFDQARGVMQSLRELGCTVALDDLGAGMSSFNYLKHLPVDYLKIDGGLVRDIVQDPISRCMVKAIRDVAKEMGKPTVAEYVENLDTLAVLRELGVEYAQGHAIGEQTFLI